MPCELIVALAAFQRVRDFVLSGVNKQIVLVYFDGIMIFSKILQEYVAHTKVVFKFIKEASVMLKLKKRTFFTNRTDYLCHVIKHGQLRVTNHTADAIRELRAPMPVTKLRSFLVIYSFFRRVVPFWQTSLHSYLNDLRNPKKRSLIPLKRKS